MTRILFICSANKDRSGTAEDYFGALYPEIQFDSAGTNEKICRQLGTTYMSKEQLDATSTIYVMETKHRKAIQEKFGGAYYDKIKVLHIKDIYPYGSKELIEILQQKLSF